jgi:hypothetical protein
MIALLALLMALVSPGVIGLGSLHAHVNPACSSNSEPNGGCAPGGVEPRSQVRHAHGVPACTGPTEPNGGCGP